jgi:hypothetical protein
LWLEASPGIKFIRPISTNGWVRWGVPIILAMLRSTNRRTAVQTNPGVEKDFMSKNNYRKRTGGIAQVIKCLPSTKPEFNHSSTKKKKKERERKRKRAPAVY